MTKPPRHRRAILPALAPALISALLALSAIVSARLPADPPVDPPAPWQELAPSMELGVFEAQKKSTVGDSRITVLRLDPARWRLRLLCAGELGKLPGLTVKEWSNAYDLAAAINAGMYGDDHSTHVGYLRAGTSVNQSHVNNYESVAAFEPKGEGRPYFRIFDRDDPATSMEAIRAGYTSVVQNLRLIKRPGINRWSQQKKRWSEAALGEDDRGCILFVFARSPWSMHDLIDQVLALGIGVVALQHLEGGPEAQLYVRHGDRKWFGSYETGFEADDDNDHAWPVPNVIGVVAR